MYVPILENKLIVKYQYTTYMYTYWKINGWLYIITVLAMFMTKVLYNIVK